MSKSHTMSVAELDSKRLLFLSNVFDGLGGVEIHEQASIYASAFGREEPNDDDYLAAVRDAIDSAMEDHAS